MDGILYRTFIILLLFIVASQSGCLSDMSDKSLEIGPDVGMRAPDFSTTARHASKEGWEDYTIDSMIDSSWTEGEDGKWLLVQFTDTDCPYSWGAGALMSEMFDEWNESVDFIVFASELGIQGHETSLSEIASFQSKLSHPGCGGGAIDCSQRPGESHPFTYADDRDLTILRAWQMDSTPSYVLLKPNGEIVWKGNGGKLNERIEHHIDGVPIYGTEVGDIPPNFITYSHEFGSNWTTFTYSVFAEQSIAEERLQLIQFTDTDCPYCWDAAGVLSQAWTDWHSETDFLVVVAELDITSHETSREEIVAFQEKLDFSGCHGDNDNCADRPGQPHQFTYAEDPGQTILRDWAISGTPMYVLVGAEGRVVWKGSSNEVLSALAQHV